MQTIEGNILDIETGIICHQVNCQGVFNAGLARQIRKKYPVVYQHYMEWYKKGIWELGMVQVVHVTDGLFVANLAGQDKYGNKQYTDYSALKKCFSELSLYDSQVYIPYGIGCGLGGGNWEIVGSLIDQVIPTAIVVKL